MGSTFTTLDLLVFFGSLIAVMSIGLLAGRKEETSEEYFLAGRRIPWWGVAGSIFGSNVSANHMIGMMGIGFSVGFAQSHFELGAIAGLMLLCYGFLPVYRRLKVYTLSEYLGRRYDDRSRIAYAVTMILIMAVVQMVPALYIGARSTCILMGGEAIEQVSLAVEPAPDSPPSSSTSTRSDRVENRPDTKLNVNRFYYALFVIALAAISASYTIFGGLKAVIWTDVMQSFLLLLAGIVLALLTFDQIGGWSEMMLRDRAGAGKMHLYLPSDHPELPWTGVLTGLMALHFFYWGTNQFIVQRALAARSDADARIGIVVAGFLKLLIPFFAIGTGVAAFYLFQERLPNRQIAPDTAFTELLLLVVQPIGFGIIGCISAGVIGAILSSIDSMMNSAATIVTMDLYRKYVNPDATDAQMIRVGPAFHCGIRDARGSDGDLGSRPQLGEKLLPSDRRLPGLSDSRAAGRVSAGTLLARRHGHRCLRHNSGWGFLLRIGGACVQLLPGIVSRRGNPSRKTAQLLSPCPRRDPVVLRCPFSGE